MDLGDLRKMSHHHSAGLRASYQEVAMEIRRAKLDDAASLSALNADVQRVHASALPRIFKQPESDAFALQFMQEHLPDALNYFFIASLDGEDVGYIFARIVDRPEDPFMYAWRYIYIDQITVKPDFRGRGVGRQLMEAVRSLAEQEGIDTIALDTWSFNTAAQAFFKKQGFELFNLRMWLGGETLPG
jgi:ribosomal protein S18 acetylase RimI-like enzyme